jgi:hypothetical protein
MSNTAWILLLLAPAILAPLVLAIAYVRAGCPLLKYRKEGETPSQNGWDVRGGSDG